MYTKKLESNNIGDKEQEKRQTWTRLCQPLSGIYWLKVDSDELILFIVNLKAYSKTTQTSKQQVH